jgi:hypothetical protein
MSRRAINRFEIDIGRLVALVAIFAMVLWAASMFWPTAGDQGFLWVLVAVLLVAGYIYLVKRVIGSMRRPFVAFAWCLLGGLSGGLIAFLVTRAYIVAHPVRSHRHEDWGAFAAAILQLMLLLASPVAGFLLTFSIALGVCWWLEPGGGAHKTGSIPTELG